jgi:hypothetical protein
MNKSILFFYLIIFLYNTRITAQIEKDSLQLQFHLKWKKEPLVLNKRYNTKNDSLQINQFKIYISAIKIDYIDNSSFSESNSYHLLDIEEVETFKIKLNTKSNKVISKLTFNIGIDSTANVSGALSGDLDASKGMYWAWQSGYINMKIEGKSNNCKTRKNAFQFHIGGYLKPNYALRTINIKENFINQNQIDINMDLYQIFEEIKLSEINSIMIPGKNATIFADLTTKIFSIE